MANSSYYGPPGSGQAVAPGTVGADTAAQQPNADIGNTHDQSASGRGAVVGGDASAKTSMGGGGSGGGGSGGGGGGYSLGASLADSTTQSLGFSGDAGNKIGGATFGDFNPNFGGTQTNGISGKVIAIGGAVVAVLGLVAVFLLRKR